MYMYIISYAGCFEHIVYISKETEKEEGEKIK